MPLRQRGRREGGIPIVSTRTVDLCDGRTARQEVVDSPAETRLEKGGGGSFLMGPRYSHTTGMSQARRLSVSLCTSHQRHA